MLKRLSLLPLALYASFALAQTPEFTAVSFYEGTATNHLEDVATDAQGNRYVTGYFYGSVTFGAETFTTTASQSHSYVVKTDSLGAVLWAVHLASTGNVQGYAIALDPAGNVIVGGYLRNDMSVDGTPFPGMGQNDIFLLKLTAAGALVWNRQMPGPEVQPIYYSTSIHDLEVDAAGNIHFTGFFTDSLTYQGETLLALGVNDIVVGKLDNEGDLLWMENAGGSYGGNCGLPNNDHGAGLALDPSGNVFITGHYAFNCAFGGSMVLTALGTVDLYVAKYSSTGSFLWARSAGGYTWQVGSAVACDEAGNVFVAGHFQYECIFGTDTLVSPSTSGNPYDVFLAKYDGAGNLLWVRQDGGYESEYCHKMEVDAEANVYLLGTYEHGATIGDSVGLEVVGSGAMRTFMAKYDDAGGFQYLVHGGGYYNYPHALCLDANNDVVLGGSTNATTFVPIVFGSVVNTVTSKFFLFLTTVDDPFNLVSAQPPMESGESLQWHPNPTTGWAQASEAFESLQVMDAQGRLVLMQGAGQAVDLGALAPGLYHLVAETQQGVVARKVVVQ